MTDERREDETSQLLREGLGGARLPENERRRIVQAAMAKARGRSRPLWPWLAAGIATAGIAFAVFSTRSTPPAPIAEAPRPAAGALWEAGAQAAVHALDGHRVEVAPGAKVRALELDPHHHAYEVAAGRASFAVRHLQQNESFRVRTAQMELQVVGTRFDVTADAQCTRVQVTEGRVRVHPAAGEQVELTPGEERVFCGAPLPEQAQPGDELVRDALSTLAQGGDRTHAEALLLQYVREHPAGGREEEARYHLWLLAARQGAKEEALARAKEYRARFPASARTQRIEEWLRTSAKE